MMTVAGETDFSEMLMKQRRPTTQTVVTSTEASTAGTCRCLFGPADPADNAVALASLRASLDRLSAARWGYDFAGGRPLPGGRYVWTEVDRRRSSSRAAGSDVGDRPALQPVNGETVTSSDHHVTSSSPPLKRRRPGVTSSRRRRRRQKMAGSDDVIGNAAVCAPASQQHRSAKRRRHNIITGAYITAR